MKKALIRFILWSVAALCWLVAFVLDITNGFNFDITQILHFCCLVLSWINAVFAERDYKREKKKEQNEQE